MLAEILFILFVVITVLSIMAIKHLGNKIVGLVPEYEKIFIGITRGKIVVVSLFGLFPAFLTLHYGALASVPKLCEKLIG